MSFQVLNRPKPMSPSHPEPSSSSGISHALNFGSLRKSRQHSGGEAGVKTRPPSGKFGFVDAYGIESGLNTEDESDYMLGENV